MENIQSSYFKKMIFFHLEEGRKLKIIKYNKNFQNFLDINIINYKLFSGKYIINEGDGIIKEYNYFNDELIFEGNYLNGKRNGKGKEYDKHGNLIFEGEYLKGKRYNGNQYFKNEIYELKNGKGIIKEILEEGYIFEGEYLNGEKNGKGKCFFYDTLFFDGEYLKGKIWNGKGYFNNKSYEIKNGKLSVKEYDEHNHLKLSFQYLNGERIGRWILFDLMGNLLMDGEYLNNKLNGKGILYYVLYNEKNFEGEFLNDRKKKGKEYIHNRLEYEGEYLYGIKWNGKGYDEKGNLAYEIINGRGKIREYDKLDNLIFEGEYLNGKRNGKGKEYDKMKNLIFEGEYLNGKRNGIGKEYVGNGLIVLMVFEGEYLNGKRNGKGKEYNKNGGELIFEGQYLNGERNGKTKEYDYESNLEFDGNI